VTYYNSLPSSWSFKIGITDRQSDTAPLSYPVRSYDPHIDRIDDLRHQRDD